MTTDTNAITTIDGPRPAKLLAKIPEAADALSVGQTTIKKLLREGRLPSVLICGARRIPVDALRKLAQRGTE
jgi:excisionase family DNA binding protein